MDEPDGQQDGDEIAEDEAENSLEHRWQDVSRQRRGIVAKGIEDVERAWRHEGRDLEDPDDRLPQHDAAECGKDCRHMRGKDADRCVEDGDLAGRLGDAADVGVDGVAHMHSSSSARRCAVALMKSTVSRIASERG